MGKFTSFLTALGKILSTGLEIVSGVFPLVQQYLPASAQGTAATVENDLTQIANTVVTAEAVLGPGTGPQKLAAVAPLVLQVLMTSQAFSGKKIGDPQGAANAAATIASGIADFINSLDGSSIKTTGSPAPIGTAQIPAPAPALTLVPALAPAAASDTAPVSGVDTAGAAAAQAQEDAKAATAAAVAKAAEAPSAADESDVVRVPPVA